jgi:hypothetical protein
LVATGTGLEVQVGEIEFFEAERAVHVVLQAKKGRGERVNFRVFIARFVLLRSSSAALLRSEQPSSTMPVLLQPSLSFITPSDHPDSTAPPRVDTTPDALLPHLGHLYTLL